MAEIENSNSAAVDVAINMLLIGTSVVIWKKLTKNNLARLVIMSMLYFLMNHSGYGTVTANIRNSLVQFNQLSGSNYILECKIQPFPPAFSNQNGHLCFVQAFARNLESFHRTPPCRSGRT